jgi:Flp pilus assembly protein protease CpaA
MPLYLAIPLTLYLALAAAWDLSTRRVPNWMTLPIAALVLLWRLARLDASFLPFWLGCLALWALNALGGGDVKLLLVLFGFFPRLEQLTLLLVIAGVCIAAILFVRYARVRGLGVWAKRTAYRLSRLQFFPSRAEMATASDPFALFIALAGIAYVWAFAVVW